jgi:hypothetical protein
MTAKKRNPVAKNMNEFNKPKTFRDRNTHAKQSGEYGDKPKHQPYKREQLIDGAYYTYEGDDTDGS